MAAGMDPCAAAQGCGILSYLLYCRAADSLLQLTGTHQLHVGSGHELGT
jgi:hypothetical protein